MKTRRIGSIALAAAAVTFFTAWALLKCGDDKTPVKSHHSGSHVRTELPDTLRAVTLYGPTSYFQYRDQDMGLDYEMVSRFARDNNMVLDLKVASGIPEMLKMLHEGSVDMIAYNVPRIAEYRKGLDYCGKNTVTRQVLVQPRKNPIRDVTGLIGRTVYVEKDSKYQYRLSNLNDELGGGIGIEAVISDTIETADLVRMVSRGELPLTVTDSDMADICAEVYKNLDVSMEVGMDQFSSWAVARGDSLLSSAINRWYSSNDVESQYKHAHKKYFEHMVMADNESGFASPDGNAAQGPGESSAPYPQGGVISRYDHLFRKYAEQIGWDWRQLAAIGYTESKFNPNITSWAGARGLMQLMPSTARQYGVADRMNDPDASIYGASRALRDLDASLSRYVRDPAERRKFVIASYNSGIGHILDAIALARKYGRDPGTWYGHVREMALLKTKPQYYNDPVVKHGYFRGRETVDFVDRVLSAYGRYRNAVPQ